LYQHHLAEDTTFVEAIAEIFVLHLRKALARGVLQGYRYEEAALTTVRGRIRIGDQVRQRYGRLPPIEVAFDEFTEDTTENQLLKAALVRLGKMPLRSHVIRRSLSEFETVFENVSSVQFDRRRLPTVRFTRLNERYRSSIALASFILRSLGVEFRDGCATTGAFLVDMADVFEDFLVVAFREHLRVTSAELPQGGKGKGLWLDYECGVHLKPDISLWDRTACRLVADVKYKVSDGGASPADIYQLLAYTVAANVRNGILIHAAGTGSVHRTRHGDKRLEVVAMNLRQDPKGILQQVASLARTIANRANDAAEGPGNLPEPRNVGVYS
jgi:5-methylcytosine-specific restriction enzyme subunit McrC